MKKYLVTVTKSFEYEIEAESEADAREQFDELEQEENTFWTDGIVFEEIK